MGCHQVAAGQDIDIEIAALDRGSLVGGRIGFGGATQGETCNKQAE